MRFLLSSQSPFRFGRTFCAILLFVFLLSTEAHSITSAPMKPGSGEIGFISSKPAERALADVQIRRIKQMISARTIDPDVAFDRWEKLQDKLRGH